MNHFLGVLRYEYAMITRRWGFWIGFILLMLPYGLEMYADLTSANASIATLTSNEVARLVYSYNLLMPVFAGVILADRLVRDDRLNVAELLHSTPLSQRAYMLGKYFGGLLAVLTPTLLTVLFYAVLAMTLGAPVSIITPFLLSFLALIVPAFAFVTAFSIACPMIMPVRVYQILFTGYWFWGNFLSPNVFPTLAGTLLTPSGEFALEAFFGATKSKLAAGEFAHTPSEAWLNWIILAACIFAALFALDRFMAWRARNA